MAELKRVNRLLNDKDLFAKRSVKIPIKPASLLTETFPLSGEASNAAVLNLCEETPRRGNALKSTKQYSDLQIFLLTWSKIGIWS